MKRWILLCLFSQFVSGCSALLPSPITRFEQQTPRPFGYVIGDEIQHRIVIETRQDVKLILDSLPKQGELNRWLNLNRVSVVSDANPGETVVELLYQVFYAPNEVKMLSVPAFTLRFDQAGKTLEKSVPPWHFTLSPLKELAVRKDESGLDYMRPDALPTPLSTRQQWLAVYVGLSLALCISLYLAYLHGLFPVWPKQRIFKRALRELSDHSQQDMGRGLAVVHHAFNVLNDQPLFKHRLQTFYQAHAEYRVAAEQIERFFEFSDKVLFAGKQDVDADDWHNLLELCRVCREIECGRR
ncbi:MAG: nonribosomal peptide synthetase MxaA [Methylomonas sp.]|jgi:mxaA protein|uniref:nonribosomal peptide synthetase MxaA n=1 Tax=Methylomonas sp. TaxID=418 RepID=UPI0025D5229F|nr:nonribosomal peptide synthetase MxaA [Methylomonas sp.]MCK9607025.1 nonribosomal peptide synthetase MxaA [Methylomonas sp.]